MMNQPVTAAASVVICSCQRARAFPAESVKLLTGRLSKAGVNFTVVPDLCELAGRRDRRLAKWAAENVKVVGCYPRAVKWLFEAAGAPLPENAQLINLRTTEAGAAAATLLTPEPISASRGPCSCDSESPEDSTASTPPADWPAWFPVIDFERCTQCLQCLSFCLFGVYGVDAEQRIQVQNPSQCKTNCPACARVCPHSAILFPKHASAPINGGTETTPEAPGAKLDISALLGGDVHGMLRARSQSRGRFAKDRDGDQALMERRRMLARQGLEAQDIPPEVLASLPPPEVIARKVQEAAARAEAALQARKKL